MATGTLTGTQMVKQKFVKDRVEKLTKGYNVTDAIFKKAPTDALSITYEVNNNVDAQEDVEQRTELGKYPRIGMGTDEKAVMIKDYGLEVLISYNAVKYNKVANIDRAYIKLKNSLIKFVDGLGLETLTDGYNASSNDINVYAAGAAWAGGTGDPFADIMQGKAKVDNNENHAYNANTAVLNPQDWTNALLDKDFRQMLDEDVAPENKIARKGVLRGEVAGVTILTSHMMQQGAMWVGERQIIGDRNENTNGTETEVYRDGNSKKSPYVASAFREFVDTLTDPKAGTYVSGI